MVPMNVSTQVSIAFFAPLAVGAVFTFLSIWISGINSKRNAQRQDELAWKMKVADQDLAVKMKLADFRQAWINQLRDCLADLQAFGLVSKYGDDEMLQIYRLSLKVRFLMNKEDPKYPALSNLIDLLTGNADVNGRIKIVRELVPLTQEILRTEWKVLKRDLKYEGSNAMAPQLPQEAAVNPS